MPTLTAALDGLRFGPDGMALARLALDASGAVVDPSTGSAARFAPTTLHARVTDLTWPISQPAGLDLSTRVQGRGSLEPRRHAPSAYGAQRAPAPPPGLRSRALGPLHPADGRAHGGRGGGPPDPRTAPRRAAVASPGDDRAQECRRIRRLGSPPPGPAHRGLGARAGLAGPAPDRAPRDSRAPRRRRARPGGRLRDRAALRPAGGSGFDGTRVRTCRRGPGAVTGAPGRCRTDPGAGRHGGVA